MDFTSEEQSKIQEIIYKLTSIGNKFGIASDERSTLIEVKEILKDIYKL